LDGFKCSTSPLCGPNVVPHVLSYAQKQYRCHVAVKDGTLPSAAPRHGHGLFHGATDAMGYSPGKVTQTDAMYAANLELYLGPLFTSSPLQTSIANDLKKMD
jgi:hypothetical protein